MLLQHRQEEPLRTLARLVADNTLVVKVLVLRLRDEEDGPRGLDGVLVRVLQKVAEAGEVAPARNGRDATRLGNLERAGPPVAVAARLWDLLQVQKRVPCLLPQGEHRLVVVRQLGAALPHHGVSLAGLALGPGRRLAAAPHSLFVLALARAGDGRL